ncbi:MAG TPA: hypothetical protein VGZ00_05860 [Candidatus Baltobacteraceae bacterium]|nr:hypothetical protein [Candidatus Baltobacteraceae bacterium]
MTTARVAASALFLAVTLTIMGWNSSAPRSAIPLRLARLSHLLRFARPMPPRSQVSLPAHSDPRHNSTAHPEQSSPLLLKRMAYKCESFTLQTVS